VVSLGAQDGALTAAVARILLERKNVTDLSEQDLALSLGWALSTVHRYLHAERVIPLDAFYRLCHALGLEPIATLLEAESRAAFGR
jgi:cyanate lyase